MSLQYAKHRLLALFGNAADGRLGLGSDLLTSQLVPRLCISLAKFDLLKVSCGGAHTAVATRGGLLFTFGLNTSGQLGHSPDQESVHEPRNVLLPEPVVDVSCGDAHTLCLTESGRVWAFGSNALGQLGLGRAAGAEARTPGLVTTIAGEVVRSIAAGSQHSLCVTEAGRMYAWGCAEDGRLGLGPAASTAPGACVWQPTPLHQPDASAHSSPSPSEPSSSPPVRFRSVAAGVLHSGALDEAGHVYVWGSGAQHRLGLPDRAGQGERVAEPAAVPGLRRMVGVRLGMTHSMALRQDERVALWGSDQAGCLGQGKPGAVLREPQLFKYWFVDGDCGFAHTAGISSDGRLYAWGWGGEARGERGAAPLLQQQAAGSSSSKGNDPSSSPPPSSSSSDGSSAGSSISSSISSRLKLGGGQLGVGGGESLASPCLVTKLEVTAGRVVRQDGGDPFNYQDGNLAWEFKQVSCGFNHSAAILEVGLPFAHALRADARPVEVRGIRP